MAKKINLRELQKENVRKTIVPVRKEKLFENEIMVDCRIASLRKEMLAGYRKKIKAVLLWVVFEDTKLDKIELREIE